jgi:hypothetical protein
MIGVSRSAVPDPGKIGGSVEYMKRFAAAYLCCAILQGSGPVTPPYHKPRAGVTGVLPGKPFQAKFEQNTRGTQINAGGWIKAMYRSTGGSLRTEVTDSNNEEFVSILDVIGNRIVVLRAKEKTALVMSFNLKESQPLWGFQAKPSYTTETREFFGVPCRKVFLSDQNSVSAGEVWIAEDLGIVVEDIESLPGGEATWRAVSIQLTEPDKALFAIPEGYKIVIAGEAPQ